MKQIRRINRFIYMKTAFLFRQYTWLVDTIRNARRINLQSLSDKWKETEMSGGFPLSRTTFNRQRDAVLDMFGLVIDCQRKGGNTYYILNEYELQKESVRSWMYSTLSLSTLLGDRKRLFNRILMERIPSADNFLRHILQAMYDNRQVFFVYKRYEADKAREFTGCPYCLKLFERRWYVAMATVKDGIVRSTPAVFSLDRIKHLELLPDKFKMPDDFDAEEFFYESFGVVVGDGTPPTTIRLRAFGRERFGMHDLPIHPSQVQIAEGPDFIDYEVYLRPTSDFKAHCASKGQWLVVLTPQSLADEIVQIHAEGIKRYADMREHI